MSAREAHGFAPHGTVRAWVEGPVVRFDVAGPFNGEGIERLLALRRNVVGDLGAGPFVALTTWRDSMLLPREGLEALRRAIASYANANAPRPLATAWVASAELEGRGLLDDWFTAIYRAADVPFRLFEDESSARAWLARYLTTAADPVRIKAQ